MQVLTPRQDDVLQWPDDAWCYRYELSQMSHRSDDYVTLPQGSEQWEQFLSYI